MGIVEVLSLVIFALLIRVSFRGVLRQYALLVVSIFVIFWLQPALPIRNLDFYLPLTTITVAVMGWLITAKSENRFDRLSWITLGIVVLEILLLSSTRYLGLDQFVLPSRPPRVAPLLVFCAVIFFAIFLIWRFKNSKTLLWGLFWALLTGLVITKFPALNQQASVFLRHLNGQSVEMATTVDVRWLGFSYVVFRLVHTIRDRQAGRLPDVSLSEYLIYIIFFPAFVAGPIDRIERFIKDLRNPQSFGTDEQLDAGKRLIVGLLKKFVIADTLAIISLNDTLSVQVDSAGWMWVFVYAYALQIYFDFSGYTDIAIGTARLLGIKLPENFQSPYTKPNLTQFWNSWHMTLTQYFRAYFFNPLTRSLRSTSRPMPTWAMILLSQVLTMVLIGLWHGITWNFILWGLWHGIGLFVHNRWADISRVWSMRFAVSPKWKLIFNASGAILNFQFVALGWVFFALSSPAISWQVMLKLFGVN